MVTCLAGLANNLPAAVSLIPDAAGQATAIQGATITASVSVIVAIGGAAVAFWRVRADRLYTRRTTALRDLQDRALGLRDAKRAYGAAVQEISHKGPALIIGPLPASGAGVGAGAPAAATAAATGSAASRSFNVEAALPGTLQAAEAEAEGAAQVAASRVDDDVVLGFYELWLSAAGQHFLDVAEVNAGSEEAAWVAFVAAVSAAYKSGSGKLRWRTKTRLEAELVAGRAAAAS